MPGQHDAKPNIWAVFGASGSGKGLWVKQRLRELKPDRLLVWDYLGEYAEFARPVATLRALAVAVVKAQAAGSGLRALYTAKANSPGKLRAEFSQWCDIAMHMRGAVVVAEELSAVTTPSWAPAGWSRLCNMGRHAGMHVIGVSQNPAQVDKGLLGSCTLMHVGALRVDEHRRAVQRSADIPLADLSGLAMGEYIERDYAQSPPALRRGVMDLRVVPKKTPVAIGAGRATAKGAADTSI